MANIHLKNINMQTVSPKLSDRVVKELIDFAGNKNAGATESIEGYSFIRRATLAELKGKFTKPEATAMVDMYNGTLLTPELQYQPEVLRAKIEDSEKYEGSCRRHGAKMADLLKKTDALTAAQVWVLQQELVRAWDNNSVEDIIKHLSHA